ncbi:Uncharacterised protein [Mycoplasmopsis maculosa]|uniref:Uncharacterized protein n=2 Tax=Mycoplasmopsis maculosa TaxID=114885 RepID=A0A449B4S7_9BACT|nr:Uncharacterised protein [Mycoplasmopsis maculosa]
MYEMINKEINLSIFKSLLNFLSEQNINYSISKYTIDAIKKTESSFSRNDIRITLYYKDFLLLSTKYPNYFVSLENNIEKDLSPYFTVMNEKIFIDLIIPTDDKKILNLSKQKIYKWLLYFGKNKRNFFLWLINLRKKRVKMIDLITLFESNRYTKMLVTFSSVNNFKKYDNLDFNNMKKVQINNEYFPVFKEFTD